MRVPHEITLVALGNGPKGEREVIDIVETSNRNASFFTRGWMRDENVTAISTARPRSDTALKLDWHTHEIKR